MLIENRLSQKRHRPLAIVGPSNELDRYASLKKDGDDDPILIELLPPSTEILRDAADLRPQSGDSTIVQVELESTLESLARSRITSALLLAGVFDPSEPKSFEQLDKLTIAVPGATSGDLTASRLAVADLEFDLEEVTLGRAAGYTEFTGYPSLRGVA